MMYEATTIAAISTAMAPAGIGIIRVSGAGAISVVDSCFFGSVSLEDAAANTVHYGHIMAEGAPREMPPHVRSAASRRAIGSSADAEGAPIDEVLVSVFRGPDSYTGEDVVEISAHGGIFVLRKILDLVIQRGAVLAGPGEFTRRRFLNGKIDLAQAESVMDIISSENSAMLKSSELQLSGILSEKLRGLREEILHETSFIEAALDDPEHYDLDGYSTRLLGEVDKWKSEIDGYVDSALEGAMLRDGIKTVILGSPNAGKSSLLNALSQMDRAIVSDIPGTTRDTLEERVSLGDFSLRIIDTAGIRSGADKIEKLGIERALAEAESADLILYVVDGSVDNSVDSMDIYSKLDDFHGKAITVVNKSDLGSVVNVDSISVGQNSVIISAKNGDGIDDLKEMIRGMFFSGDIGFSDNIFITNLRHKAALMDASMSLSNVVTAIDNGMPEDIFTVDLLDAYVSLGKILGESLEDDLVDKIFSDFCMGK